MFKLLLLQITLECIHALIPKLYISSMFQYFQLMGSLKHLTYLDVSKNNIETLEEGVSGCESLQDLLLSSNSLQQLPESIGVYYPTFTINTLNMLVVDKPFFSHVHLI